MATKPSILGPDWVCFGSIGKTHGLKGAFLLKTEDNSSQWPGYLDLRFVDAKGAKPCKVLKSYVSSGMLALQLDLFASLETAQAVRGAQLFVNRSEIKVLEGESLIDDMLGVAVIDETGKPWGKIVAVVSFGAQQNLELEVPGRNETVLFPYMDDFIVSEDLKNKKMVIKYVAEFLDEEMASK